MAKDMDTEIAALRRMTASQLRARYEVLFGDRSRSGNRDWLFRRCVWRVCRSVWSSVNICVDNPW